VQEERGDRGKPGSRVGGTARGKKVWEAKISKTKGKKGGERNSREQGRNSESLRDTLLTGGGAGTLWSLESGVGAIKKRAIVANH